MNERSLFLLTPYATLYILLFMKILVCIKQVCESDSPIKIDDHAGWIQSDAITGYKMNRLDEFAVEEAVLLKKAYPGTSIDAISVGPDRSAEVIKRAIGMGADHGVHIITESKGYINPFTIASGIADYARDKHYTIIFAGVISEDQMQGQVGPMIAACLSLPWATAVIRQQMAPDNKSIYVEREIEGGSRDTLQLQLPAVLTIQSGINTPRYPSLSNLLRANKQKLETVQAGNPAQASLRESIFRLVYPEKSRAGTFLSGSQQEKASRLLSLLREKALLR
jgi:electron transfer flavoprotein beta subunit